MSLEKYFEMGMVNGVDVKIIIRPLTKEESRRIFNREPNKFGESSFGGDRFTDDDALVSLGKGRPCIMCQAVTHNELLDFNICPDCDGRSEAAGKDPHRPEPLPECCGGPCREGSNHIPSKECCGGKSHHR